MKISDIKKYPKLWEFFCKSVEDYGKTLDMLEVEKMGIDEASLWSKSNGGSEFWWALNNSEEEHDMYFQVAKNLHPELFEQPLGNSCSAILDQVNLYPLRDNVDNSEDTNLSLLARIIISQDVLRRGHGQLEVNRNLSLEEAAELSKELEDYYQENNPDYSVIIKYWVDLGGSLYLYNPDEPNNDIILFSWGED